MKAKGAAENERIHIKKRGEFKSDEDWLLYLREQVEDGAISWDEYFEMTVDAEDIPEDLIDKIDRKWIRKSCLKNAFDYDGSAQRGKFLIVPFKLIFAGRHLTPSEKMMWQALLAHDWRPEGLRHRIYPSRKRLATILGISERQVSKLTGELRKKGLLDVKRRLNRSNIYILHDPPSEWEEETEKRLKRQKRKKAFQQEQNLEESKD